MINEVYIDPNQYVNPAKTSEDFEYAGFRGILADKSSHRFTDTEMRTLHNMFSKWSAGGLNASLTLENFNRFYSIFPDMEMPSDLKSYIFITRPEMNLFGSSSQSYRLSSNEKVSLSADNVNDQRLQYMATLQPEVLKMLSEDLSSEHEFIPYLQGRAESLQLPDYQIRTSDFTIPFFSYKYTYPTVTNESITGGTFDISFREDSDLRITKLFQFWIYYMDAVIKNKMKPSAQHIWNNQYDFMCSVYEIICDPTSERILYWAKYTGCYPTSVPISNLSHNIKSNVDNKVNITFNYMMVEAFEPAVLTDFNENSHPYGSPVEDYDLDHGISGSSLVGAPRIVMSSDQHSLLLRWYPRRTGQISSLAKNSPTLSNINVALNHADSYRAQILAHRDSLGVNTSPSRSSSALSYYLKSSTDRRLESR